MKKIWILFFVLPVLRFGAQSSILGVRLPDFASSPVPNGATYFYTTQSNSITLSRFFVKNISASTQTIIVKRTNIFLNQVSSTDKASAEFCFWYDCLTPEMTADTVVFVPNQDAELDAQLLEASVAGNSRVSYHAYDMNHPADGVTFYIVYTGIVSVKENIPDNAFSIYPQPCDKNFFVQMNGKGPAQIEVRDLEANVVMKTTVNAISGEALPLSVESLASGLYFISIQTNGQNFVRKLAVRH